MTIAAEKYQSVLESNDDSSTEEVRRSVIVPCRVWTVFGVVGTLLTVCIAVAALSSGGTSGGLLQSSSRDTVELQSSTKKTYFDISIGGRHAGRIVFGLYGNIVPKTVNNFVELSKGRPGLSYKGSTFHRVIPGEMIQGGDITRGDGTGSKSIYGKLFEDESFTVKFNRPGQLAMANTGPNTNGSQFFITTERLSHLDGKNVVFGEVLEGMDVVKAIENVQTDGTRPTSRVMIEDAGEL